MVSLARVIRKEHQKARDIFEQAMGIIETESARNPNNRLLMQTEAETLFMFALFEGTLGRFDLAIPKLENAAKIYRQLNGSKIAEPKLIYDEVDTLLRLGEASLRSNQESLAADALHSALNITQKALKKSPHDSKLNELYDEVASYFELTPENPQN